MKSKEEGKIVKKLSLLYCKVEHCD